MNIRMFPRSVIKHFPDASSGAYSLRHRVLPHLVIGRFRPLFPLRKKSLSNKLIYIIIYIITLYALFVKFRPLYTFHPPLPYVSLPPRAPFPRTATGTPGIPLLFLRPPKQAAARQVTFSTVIRDTVISAACHIKPSGITVPAIQAAAQSKRYSRRAHALSPRYFSATSP